MKRSVKQHKKINGNNHRKVPRFARDDKVWQGQRGKGPVLVGRVA
jgi:hypothetical protein